MNKNDTLHGGRNITVKFEPVADPAAEGGFRKPAEESIKVRQVRIAEFPAGFELVKTKDEVGLVAFLCARQKPWVLTLQPESYEDILTAGREVNERGFFSFCRRRTEQEEAADASWIAKMTNLPPETLKLAMEMGRKSTLPSLPPGYVPPPAR